MESKGKVLIVDDNDNIRLFTSTVLKKENFKVFHATNGLNALKILKKEKDIDIILLDIMMPLMNGYEVLRALKSHQLENTYKVCVMSTRGTKQDIIKALKLGAKDYLVKAIDRSTLIDRVNKLIEEEIESTEFFSIETNLLGIVENLPFAVTVKVNKLSEQSLSFTTKQIPIIGDHLNLSIPFLNDLLGEELPLMCHIVDYKEFEGMNMVKVNIIGLDEIQAQKLRKVIISNKTINDNSPMDLF